MIGDLNETLKQLLIDRIPLDPREVAIAFDPPDSEWSGSVATPTINCYLYHIQENQRLRTSDWERQRPGERGEITRKRLPFRLELHYLITVWATAVEDEHRLLWRILGVLMPYQNLPQATLKGELARSEWPVPVLVAQPEGPLKNPTDFWSTFEKFVKPSVTCAFTIPLDPELSFSVPPVLSRRIRLQEIAGPGKDGEVFSLGGYVLDAPDDHLGVPGILVLVLERGDRQVTDRYGRFRFDGLPAGPYTLEARGDGRVSRRQITLAAGQDQLHDLVLPPTGSAPSPSAGEARDKERR